MPCGVTDERQAQRAELRLANVGGVPRAALPARSRREPPSRGPPQTPPRADRSVSAASEGSGSEGARVDMEPQHGSDSSSVRGGALVPVSPSWQRDGGGLRAQLRRAEAELQLQQEGVMHPARPQLLAPPPRAACTAGHAERRCVCPTTAGAPRADAGRRRGERPEISWRCARLLPGYAARKAGRCDTSSNRSNSSP